MSRKLTLFLVISFGWAALVGTGLFVTGTALDSLQGVIAMAVLYMPSPIIAALIAERVIRRDRFRLPRGGTGKVFRFLLTPVAVIVAFAFLYLVAVLIGGELLGISLFGGIATTQAELMEGAAGLLGEAAVEAAGPPPPAIVLLLAGVWGAIVAGWTINGLVAMGEEYGWRGLMWDELKGQGPVRANLLIGAAWGLWHTPVILQGYNYPGYPVAGIVAMVTFCTGMSFVLTAIRERTGSLLPVAAAHGMFNALAVILLLLSPGTTSVITGPLGLLGAALLVAIGGLLWSRAHRAVPPARNCEGRSSSTFPVGLAPTQPPMPIDPSSLLA